MAAAAGIADQWRRACWFFSGAVWDVDDLGLAVARLIVKYLLAGGRAGHGGGRRDVLQAVGTQGRSEARWAYDGSAQGGKKIAFGNTWVIAAIV